MTIIALFAAEFGPHNSLGIETTNRCLAALKCFQKNLNSIVLVAAGSNPLDKSSPLQSQLMRDFLITKGIPSNHVVICGEAQSTIEEIEAMAKLLNNQFKESASEIYVVSSWYHLPRILFWWQRQTHLEVHPVSTWEFSFYSFKRAILEPFKFILPFLKLPPRFQEKMKFWFRRVGLI